MAVFRPFLTLLMAASVCTASVQTSREKRSDDPDPIATVVSTHSQQLNQLTAQFAALQNGFNQLTSESAHFNQLTSQFAALQNDFNQLLPQFAALQNGFNQLQSKVSHHVAFHVRLNNDHHITLSSGQVIKFDYVLTNVGSTYNPANGIFTAPVAGLYAFVFSTSSTDASASGKVTLRSGNHNVFADTRDTMATGSGVFHLNQGDRVWIEGNGNGVHLYSYDTTFTGFLVTAD